MRPRSFVYPPAFLVWLWVVWSLRGPFRALTRGEPIDRERLARARRRVINLPWWVVVVCGTGWGLCIPVFLWRLQAGAEPLHPMVYAHLPISFVISGMIATTHGFFGVELLTQRRLYPVFFHDSPAWRTPGGHALSLRERGLLWALSAGVCPIVSLVLLAIVPKPVEEPGFALAVGAIGILFGLVTAWLVGRLVTEPIDDLTGAALSVSQGDLGVSIERSRADEFGPLIDAFNTMVGGLREKVRIEENFGRHVGQAVAREIMARPEGLGGAEQQITVLFLDIRGFTARVLGEPLLVTAATRAALRGEAALEELAPQRVKGQRDPIVVFRPMESSPSPRARRR